MGVVNGCGHELLVFCANSFDNASALDSLDPSATSEFNVAFIKAISEEKKKSLSQVHDDIVTGRPHPLLLVWLTIVADPAGMRHSAQKPVCRMGMADTHITLQDPIMVDDQNLVETLDKIQQEYVCAHSRSMLHAFADTGACMC